MAPEYHWRRGWLPATEDTDEAQQPAQLTPGNCDIGDEVQVVGSQRVVKGSGGGNYADAGDYGDEEVEVAGAKRVVKGSGGGDGRFAYDQDYAGRFQQSRQMAFIRKIYTILTLQLMLTAGTVCLMMFVDSVKDYVQDHAWLTYVAYGLSFVTLIPMICCFRKRYPMNAILLFFFTICMSFMVGVICTFYDSEVVLKASLITVGLFLVLTLYTCVSKTDFHFLGAGLFAALWVLIIAGFMQLFFPYNHIVHMVYCWLGAGIFCLFIIYDTNKIVKRYQQPGGSFDDEWLIAVIDLYLDVLNLFLFILQILGGGNRR